MTLPVEVELLGLEGCGMAEEKASWKLFFWNVMRWQCASTWWRGTLQHLGGCQQLVYLSAAHLAPLLCLGHPAWALAQGKITALPTLPRGSWSCCVAVEGGLHRALTSKNSFQLWLLSQSQGLGTAVPTTCRYLCPDLVAQTKSLLDFCSVSSAEVLTFIPCIFFICLSKTSKSLLLCMPYTTSWNLSSVSDPWLFAWQFLQALSVSMTCSIKCLSLDNKESFNDIWMLSAVSIG